MKSVRAGVETGRHACSPWGALLLVAAFIGATGLHALLYAQGFYGISWDDAGRTLDAFEWRQHPELHATAWLPFHRILMGAALAAFPDLFVTPRVVTFLFGLASLGLLTWLADELFRNRRITIATALFGAVFMPRVVLTLAPLSCVPFSCVIVGAMAALARWLRTATRASLVLAACAFAVSTTIRYEGWAFAAAFALMVWACRWTQPHRVGWSDVALSAIVVSIFPLLWMAVSAAESGGALAAVDKNGTAYADWLLVLRKNPLTELVVINALTLNAIGLWSTIVRARRDARFRRFLFVAATPLLLISVALLMAKRAQSGPSWRMIVVWSLLLVPFTVDTVHSLTRRLPRFGRPLAAAALVGLALLSLFGTHRMYWQSRWAIPPITRDIGRDLSARLATYPKEARVLIESSSYSFLNLLVSSQQPDRFINNSVPEVEDDPSAIVAADRPLSLPELQRRNIRVLVFRTRALRDRLDGEPALRRVADYGEWSVYELS